MTGDSGKTKGDLDRWLAKLRATDIGDDGWVEAIEGLVSLGVDAVPDLVEALGDEQLSVYVGVGNALSRMGSAVAYDMIGALKHDNWAVRLRAVLYLYYTATSGDPVAGDAVPALCEALKDSDRGVRHWAAMALGEIGNDASQAVPDLIDALRDPESMVRQWAASALGRIGLEAKSAMGALTEALLDDDPEVRQNASYSLDVIQSA